MSSDDDRPPSERSRHCRENIHDSCPHWGDFSTSLRFLRVEFNRVLCACGCHDACPLHGQRRITDAVWRLQCTCPGADEAKRSRKSTIPKNIDVREIHRRAKEKRQRREDIERTVLEAVGHADRAAVRTRLIEEFALRDVAVPPPPFVELRVDSILARGDVVARGRLAVESWTSVASAGLRAARNLYDVAQTARNGSVAEANQPPPDLDDLADEAAAGVTTNPRTRYVKSDRTRWVEVNLDPDSVSALATAPTAGGFNLRDLSGVLIVLWRVSGTSSPVLVDRKADPRTPIGILEGKDGAAFADILTDAERDGVELTSIGVRWKDPGGSWHVYVFLPGAPSARSQV